MNDPRMHVKITTAAEMLGLPPRTVRNWVETEQVTAYQLAAGKARYVSLVDVMIVAAKLGFTVDLQSVLDHMA